MKIFDTSSMILFNDILNMPHLLDGWMKHNRQLLITDAVKIEFLKNPVNHQILNSLKILNSERLDQQIILQNKYPQLGPGEISVICLGLELKLNGKDYYCILDEKKAREIARSLNVETTGSIGLLGRMYEKKMFNHEIRNKIYQIIKKSKFRVSEQLLSILMKKCQK